jgi:hypothetical protein
MPKRQIFEQEQAPRLAARKQGAEQNQDSIRHSESSFEQSSQEIKDSDGLRGFRPHRINRGFQFREACKITS